jgi:hypothetical protein
MDIFPSFLFSKERVPLPGKQCIPPWFLLVKREETMEECIVYPEEGLFLFKREETMEECIVYPEEGLFLFKREETMEECIVYPEEGLFL